MPVFENLRTTNYFLWIRKNLKIVDYPWPIPGNLKQLVILYQFSQIWYYFLIIKNKFSKLELELNIY